MSDIQQARNSKIEIFSILEQNKEIIDLIDRTIKKYPQQPDWLERWLHKKISEIIDNNKELDNNIRQVYNNYKIFISKHDTLISNNQLFKQHLKIFIVGRLLE